MSYVYRCTVDLLSRLWSGAPIVPADTQAHTTARPEEQPPPTTATTTTATTASFSTLPDPALIAILAAAFRPGSGSDFVSLLCTCRRVADLAASPTSSLWSVLLEQQNNNNNSINNNNGGGGGDGTAAAARGGHDEADDSEEDGDDDEWSRVEAAPSLLPPATTATNRGDGDPSHQREQEGGRENGNVMAVTPRDALRDLVERPVWVPRMPGFLFTFGRGSSFRLGKPSEEDTSSPVSPLGNTKVIMMGAGQYHMVVATTERQLFFWGDLKIDFKGDAPKDISSLLPSTFKWPPRQISCSHHSFGLVDSNKKAFCSARQPLSIMQLRFSNVKQLEMRSFHTVVLTEDGTVWQSGEHNDGRMRRVTTGVKSLGIGAWGTATLIMKSGGAQKLSEGGNLFSHSLRDGERVLRAADGHTSSLWLTSHGVVEVTHSKLDSEKRYPPFAATATAPPPSSGDEQLLHNDSSSLCKVCAAADYSSPKQHYAALTRWGDVFTWGYCPSFECGVRMCKSVEAPGVVPWVPPGSCLDVVTGENFTAVLLTGQPSSLDMRFPWIKNQCNN